jgi:hypothetical protein
MTGHVIRQGRELALGRKLPPDAELALRRKLRLARARPGLSAPAPRIPRKVTPSTVAHVVES